MNHFSTEARLHLEPVKNQALPTADKNPMIACFDSVKATGGDEHQTLNIAKNADSTTPKLYREALPGIVGGIIENILPHTEASEAALLVSLLAGFGSMAGRNRYTYAGPSKHYANLNVVLAGKTGKGRKGTSWSTIKPILSLLDEDWTTGCIANGLSSGEGLIHHVRDERTEKKAQKKGGKITGYQDEIVDEGVSDKRLFVIEEEFGSVLKRMGRKENSLSPIIREAWDGSNLRSLVKGSPDKATCPHITILGHITKTEALSLMTGVDCHNGFANRFLWIFTERSKCLPEGRAVPLAELSEGIKYLQDTLSKAKKIEGEMSMSDEASALWRSVYPQLSDGRHGLFGAVTGRAEAQVKRLCFLYALIAGENEQSLTSLKAALALWRYCEATAKWMFGSSFNNKDADKLHQALKAHQEGMTRTEINGEVFKNHVENDRVNKALKVLDEAGAVRCELDNPEGRSREVWFSQ